MKIEYLRFASGGSVLKRMKLFRNSRINLIHLNSGFVSDLSFEI
ncbi:hypothetical protein D1BOALGB6SA_4701 [Olavius sp. associated proteobacterium Delta 1]|nr:hypothetical protein D1BOALGB6SA_4701 [Olavius sp. associated proteobacterium Delta 1]